MLVRWPDRAPAGAESDVIWYFADVLPTLAAMGDVTPPGNIDGVDVLPSILDHEQPELRERFLYWEFHERGFAQAARRGYWKAGRRGYDGALEFVQSGQGHR